MSFADFYIFRCFDPMILIEWNDWNLKWNNTNCDLNVDVRFDDR